MRKFLFFVLFVVVAAFLAPAATAQTSVVNTTSKVITLKSSNNTSEITVNPHKKVAVPFAPAAGNFEFSLFYYEGMNEKALGSVSKAISRGTIEITQKDLSGIKEAPKSVTAPKSANENSNAGYNQPKNVQMVNVFLVDSSEFRFVCLDGPFAGVALKPGQTTTEKYAVPMGQLELTFKHDFETEAQAHGRKYRQSVYSGIIVQGQETLVIKNENLTQMGGETIKTFAKSLIPFKFVFTAGQWKGQALNFKEFTKKAELNEGFNSLAIQFVGADGLKYQADIEVIVTQRDRPLVFRESDIKNRRIKQ